MGSLFTSRPGGPARAFVDSNSTEADKHADPAKGWEIWAIFRCNPDRNSPGRTGAALTTSAIMLPGFRHTQATEGHMAVTRIPIPEWARIQRADDRLELSLAEIDLCVRTVNCLEEDAIFTRYCQ